LSNRIQNIRKDSGFEVTDKIKVQVCKSLAIEEAIEANRKYIKSRNFNRDLMFEENA
jgi:isoleucyl-tRNA synthetase